MIGVGLSTILMIAYIGWYTTNYGVPWSLSHTVYKLPHEAVFTLVMFAMAFLNIIPMMEACSENTKVLAFLTMASIGFVGAAPLGRNCDERVHMGAAMLFGLCSQLMVAFNIPVLLFVFLPAVVWLTATRGRNWLFWLEVACIIDLLLFCVSPYCF